MNESSSVSTSNWLIIPIISLLFLPGCVTKKQAQADYSQNISDHAASDWERVTGNIMTRWAKDVSPDNVLPEYPRPQMVRNEWKNLNGLWDYAIVSRQESTPETWDGEILVPFAVESALSGVKKRVGAEKNLWYHEKFVVPDEWEGQRVLLHFGAIDWKATVYINGREMGTHRGGYDAFTLDITDALTSTEVQEVMVKVYDPTDEGNQPRGKQVKKPRGIWYTPVTGIWQTVWLEPVNNAHIGSLWMIPDVDNSQLKLSINEQGTNAEYTVVATAFKNGRKVDQVKGNADEELHLSIPEPRLWSPEDPFLYDLEVSLHKNGQQVDKVESYFGMRSIEIGKDEEGRSRILLNGEFVFQLGPLDQGYWPAGLYTAPTDVALRHDLEMTKKLGFNMNRKHVKVEPARWYYWADKLGVIIWQDMPNADNVTEESQKQYEKELREIITQNLNHPSIVQWGIFNEGWGQFDTKRITKWVEELDPSRLVTDASGWQHMEAGDVIDIHRYPGPAAIRPKPGRASIVGEFGGVGYVVDGHTWAGEGWGYQGVIQRPEAYINRYEELIKKLWWFKDEAGISAGIYTQLTDLEKEINGIITYDREIVKAPGARIASVNKGLTPLIWPLDRRFINSITVKLMNWEEGSEIRYTLNGSEPTTSSPRYETPLVIKRPLTLKARTFKNGEPIGYPESAAFEKVEGRDPVVVNKADLEQGLRYIYYENPENDAATFRKHWTLRRHLRQGDTLTSTETGTISNFDLSPKIRDKLFTFEFTGYIEVPRDGVYTFYLQADDDAKIYIGDTQIFDRLGQSPDMTYDFARVPLKAGLHPIKLGYFQAYGPYGLNVSYAGPGIEKQPIPDGQLYYSDTLAR